MLWIVFDPFLRTSTVHTLFHADGTVLEDQTIEIS